LDNSLLLGAETGWLATGRRRSKLLLLLRLFSKHWRLGLGLGLFSEDWGLGLGLRLFSEDWRLSLRLGLFSEHWGLCLGLRLLSEDWRLGLGLGLFSKNWSLGLLGRLPLSWNKRLKLLLFARVDGTESLISRKCWNDNSTLRISPWS
jgi:hypothetical protein